MELLRQIPDSQPLVAWGQPYNAYKDPSIEPEPKPGGQIPLQVLRIVSYPICPVCKEFSYFCAPAGDFSKHAATEWRQSVIGFVLSSGSSDYAGTITVICPKCKVAFGFNLKRDSVDAYRTDCPLWPKVEVVPADKSAEQALRIKNLRMSAGFPNSDLDDQTFLAELDKRELENNRKSK